MNLKKRQQLLSFKNEKELRELVFFGICLNLARRRVKSFFFRRKILTVEGNFNPQNNKVLAAHSEDVFEDMLTVYRRQKPASVMVWAAVSKTGNIFLFL